MKKRIVAFSVVLLLVATFAHSQVRMKSASFTLTDPKGEPLPYIYAFVQQIQEDGSQAAAVWVRDELEYEKFQDTVDAEATLTQWVHEALEEEILYTQEDYKEVKNYQDTPVLWENNTMFYVLEVCNEDWDYELISAWNVMADGKAQFRLWKVKSE